MSRLKPKEKPRESPRRLLNLPDLHACLLLQKAAERLLRLLEGLRLSRAAARKITDGLDDFFIDDDDDYDDNMMILLRLQLH